MTSSTQVSMFDLMMSLSMAMDIINPTLMNHHKQVAYLSHALALEYGLSDSERKNLVFAGSVHDIGALKLKERLELKNYMPENPHEHAEFGYRLLKTMEALSPEAELVRFHHVHWDKGQGLRFKGKDVPLGSHIIHLSDRISALIDPSRNILGQMKEIKNRIIEQKDKMFHPDLIDAFLSMSDKEYFWLDLTSNFIQDILSKELDFESLDQDNLLDLAKLFARIIDFRSPFTATHSSGLAAVSRGIAEYYGFPDHECLMMEIAGYLHDIGKLAVPAEILEKPEILTAEDIHIIRAHAYYTYRILGQIDGLKEVNEWASFHHERIDGKGYPFHIKGENLSVGSRILAVADVFTALTEERPYRDGLDEAKTMKIIKSMVKSGALDVNIVNLIDSKFEIINKSRAEAQESAWQLHREFHSYNN
ncbi:HD domain-containing protein [bacterium]|nr:HD domain-containing protein [bacterium]